MQIEQLEAKARLKNEMQERVVKEQRMKQERESLEETIKREQKYQECLKEYGKGMDKLREEA